MSSAAILRPAESLETFRISPQDTNRMAVIADPIRDRVPFIAIVEIFDPHGKTPPNTHQEAYELFFVLSGRGFAQCDGNRFAVGPGDSFLVRPGHEHVVDNPYDERLYCLTVMVPNEGFAELIRSGLPDKLDHIDLSVLRGGATGRQAASAERQ
jgi:mannose-6-phosphate isomerase-like protein (cupin superfamily)